MSEQTRSPDPDPVLSSFAMPLHGTYFPLGFPLEVATNSADVLMAAQESWGQSREAFSEKPVQIRIGVLEGSGEARLPVHVVRSQGHLLVTLGGTEDFAVCDMKQGFGFGWVTAATASNHAHLRYYYLESMAYALLQALYLTPIHAACVALNGHGLLLCGDSEAGKSSLAYACARSGWTFISDDATYLLRGWKGNVVIGNPHWIRLRESAPMLFPGLGEYPITLRAQGDRSIELATAAEPNLITAPYSRTDHIIFLNRQNSGPAVLSPFPTEEALCKLEAVLCYGEREVREAQAASLRELLRGDVLEFRYSDLNTAVAALESLVGKTEGASRAREFSMGCQENV
jgi:hypothetical protein